MMLNPSNGRLYSKITSDRHYPLSVSALFFLLLIGYFSAWPIEMTDTDLWYHLSGGRYFWQNGTIAHDAFFSYITPPKTWYNYYWLFQAIVYKIFLWTDYYGLIALRCLLYSLTALFIYLTFTSRQENRSALLCSSFFSVACTIVILYRELAVRPHLFTYLFIVVFLYILEIRREKFWILPLIGIFWCNVHGIEYPVMFLIVIAYLAEIYWRQLRKIGSEDAVGKKEKWLLISVLYTIFITPGVIELIQTPFNVSFQNAAYQYLYVKELLPIPFKDFFSFTFNSAQGLIFSLQNIIVLLTAAFFLAGIWKRNLRISHAILFIGAILLLFKHSRFTYEFTLLSIPLLCHGVRLLANRDRLPRMTVDLALPTVMILVPFLVFHSVLGNRPAYPFSTSNLPAGVVRFLNQNASGGNILNDMNTGGYLPWALHPDFKIYMDMQMTIFSDTDFATAENAFFDVNAFRAFTRKYDPSFISVSLNNPHFKKVVATDSRFVPVFFDQAEALYVNKSHLSGLAEKYALKAIDPFHYGEVIYANESPEKLSEIFAEARRILEQDPANYRANHILSSISVVRRQFDRALSYAEVIIRNYPELSHGYALKGDALFGMERYEEAARLYKKALDMGRTAKSEHVYWNLHASYYNLKEYKKAYQVLSKYVNPFSLNADYKEIYQLAMSAASVGKIVEAVKFLKIARMKVPEADAGYVEKIDKNLTLLETNAKEQ